MRPQVYTKQQARGYREGVLGLSVKEAARALGIKANTLKCYESQNVAVPPIHMAKMQRLAFDLGKIANNPGLQGLNASSRREAAKTETTWTDVSPAGVVSTDIPETLATSFVKSETRTGEYAQFLAFRSNNALQAARAIWEQAIAKRQTELTLLENGSEADIKAYLFK